MHFNQSVFETQCRNSTKLDKSDSGCQRLRLQPRRDGSGQSPGKEPTNLIIYTQQNVIFIMAETLEHHDVFDRLKSHRKVKMCNVVTQKNAYSNVAIKEED